MRLVIVACLLLVSGCVLGPSQEKPIGVGSDRDSFPPSPCACGKPFYVDGRLVS